MATETSGQVTETDLQSLKQDLAALRKDLISLGHNTASSVRREAHELKGRAQKGWEDSIESIESKIIERPITTVLVALGVGLLAGKLFSR